MDEKELLLDADKILKVSSNFRQRIEFSETSWLNESEALKLFESQVEISETVRDLIRKDRCAEAFILIRSIFENYFLVAIMLKGTKYRLRYRVSSTPNEAPKQAYSRLIAEIEKQIAEGRRDIVSYKAVKSYRQIEIVHKGLFSEKGERITPVYYFVFKEYDPIKHRIDRVPSIASKELFSEHIGKWQRKHETLYRTYLGFKNVLEVALINELITEEQRIRVSVHYNFLSGFTHLTRMGFDLIKSYAWERNTHYLKELGLLYVIRILRLYLLLLIDFFSKTEHKISDPEKLTSYLDELGRKYDYFWFIFNRPSEYDFWKYQTAREYHRKKGKLLDEQIPYYKDPYNRLRRQHQTVHELTTGLIYTSPWPRKDALY